MISLVTGLPGSGKSHYMVKEFVLKALLGGRRVHAVLALKSHEVWAAALGCTVEQARERLLVHSDLGFLKDVRPTDLVVIDEAQRFFRSGGAPDKDVLYWLETHRHIPCDVILATQHYQKIFQQVYNMAEIVYCFRKLSFIGLSGATRLTVKGGVRETDTLRKETLKFDPFIYNLFNSYDGAGVSEIKSGAGSIWRSWTVRFAILAVAVVGYVVAYRPWISVSASPAAVADKATSGINHPASAVVGGAGNLTAISPPVPPAPPAGKIGPYAVPVLAKPCIVGSIGNEDGSDYWFLLSDGRRVRLQELQAKYSPALWRKDPLAGWMFESVGVGYARMGGGADNPSG